MTYKKVSGALRTQAAYTAVQGLLPNPEIVDYYFGNFEQAGTPFEIIYDDAVGGAAIVTTLQTTGYTNYYRNENATGYTTAADTQRAEQARRTALEVQLDVSSAAYNATQVAATIAYAKKLGYNTKTDAEIDAMASGAYEQLEEYLDETMRRLQLIEQYLYYTSGSFSDPDQVRRAAAKTDAELSGTIEREKTVL